MLLLGQLTLHLGQHILHSTKLKMQCMWTASAARGRRQYLIVFLLDQLLLLFVGVDFVGARLFARLQLVRTVVFVVNLVRHLLQILHVSAADEEQKSIDRRSSHEDERLHEHGSQFDEVAVLGVFHFD